MARAKVNSEGLKVHENPRNSSPLLKFADKLQFGDEVRIVDATNAGTWSRIIVTKTKSGIGEGENGWCATRFLTVIAEPPDVPKPDPMPAPPQRHPLDMWPLYIVAELVVATAASAWLAWMWTVPV